MFLLKELQAIFFDFDGVLVESMHVKTEAFAQLFRKFGDEVVEKVVKHHIENGGISRYVKIKHYYNNFLDEQINQEKIDEKAQQFSDIVVKKVIKSSWVTGAEKFLEENYKKIDMYVISGTPQQELRKIVKERDMGKYFKGIYGTPKTKPEIMKMIISEKKYDKNKTLYIGDSFSDYTDSKKAEVPFLGRVPNGKKSIFPEKIKYISDFLDIKQ